MSGRSQLFKVNRIMFRHIDTPFGEVSSLQNTESSFVDDSVPLSGFDQFVTVNSLTEGALGDDDRDGVSNLLEYALGGDPTDSTDSNDCRIMAEALLQLVKFPVWKV